jgi:hypothetical protein
MGSSRAEETPTTVLAAILPRFTVRREADSVRLDRAATPMVTVWRSETRCTSMGGLPRAWSAAAAAAHPRDTHMTLGPRCNTRYTLILAYLLLRTQHHRLLLRATRTHCEALSAQRVHVRATRAARRPLDAAPFLLALHATESHTSLHTQAWSSLQLHRAWMRSRRASG